MQGFVFWLVAGAVSISIASEPTIPVPEMVEIPAGEFSMGLRKIGEGSGGVSEVNPLCVSPGLGGEITAAVSPGFGGEVQDLLPLRYSPRRTVRIEAFEIGRYEITNTEYSAFMRAGGYQNRAYWSEEGWAAKERYGWELPETWRDKRYRTHRDLSEDNDPLPVTGVSWFEACAYCRWLSEQSGDRYELPSEEQWEYAARGTRDFLWPWGNTWEETRCNFGDDLDGDRFPDGGLDEQIYPAPVGFYPQGASPFGCMDMAGNAEEWCRNRYEEEGPWCAYRVLRGGSWLTVSPRNLTTVFRGGTFPWVRYIFWGTIGFRVVRIPQGGQTFSNTQSNGQNALFPLNERAKD